VALTLVAMAVPVGVVGFGVMDGIVARPFWRGIIQRPVHVHLLLHRIMWPQYVILHPIMLKRTLQHVLQSMTTEISECHAKSGIMCACRTTSGRQGRSSRVVWVNWIQLTLGRRATSGLLIDWMSVIGA
jgi:hypothetical protein